MNIFRSLQNAAAALTDFAGITSPESREYAALDPAQKQAIDTLRELARNDSTVWRDTSNHLVGRGIIQFSAEVGGTIYSVFESYGPHHHDFGYTTESSAGRQYLGRESLCAEAVFNAIESRQRASETALPIAERKTDPVPSKPDRASVESLFALFKEVSKNPVVHRSLERAFDMLWSEVSKAGGSIEVDAVSDEAGITIKIPNENPVRLKLTAGTDGEDRTLAAMGRSAIAGSLRGNEPDFRQAAYNTALHSLRIALMAESNARNL